MAKKATTPIAAADVPVLIEHVSVVPLGGGLFRLKADRGYLVRSRATDHTWRVTLTRRPEGYEGVPAAVLGGGL